MTEEAHNEDFSSHPITHKDLRGAYEYIESVRSEHAKTANELSSLKTEVNNVVNAVNKLSDTVAERGKFPIGTVLTGIGLVVTMIVVLAGGYVGKPLSRHEVSIIDLDNRITEYQKAAEFNRGVSSTQLKHILTVLKRDENRTYNHLNELSRNTHEEDVRTIEELSDRLRTIESNRFTKEDAREMIRNLYISK